MSRLLKTCGLITLAASAAILWPAMAPAMEPPEPGMLAQMARNGTLPAAQAFAKKLGTYKPKMPLRGARVPNESPQRIAERIADYFGMTLSGKAPSAIASSTPKENEWLAYDLNCDRTVDERDVLALGFPRPKATADLPALGTVKAFALLIEFPNYLHYFPKTEFETNLFGNGYTDGSGTHSLHWFYNQASYGGLDIEGSVYGWYTAKHDRSYYHPNDSSDYPWDGDRWNEMVEEALRDADEKGADFSQYDNDGDGSVDYFLIIYTGPHGAWATFWWGYYGAGLPTSFSLDGVHFYNTSFQWERYFGFGETPPTPSHWDPYVTIHETGHSLGLPDYYDYDGSVGPDGGVGGLDQMDHNWGDHNCFSKYMLGWLTPTFAFANLNDEQLSKSNANPDAVLVMPGYDPVSPWAEYFMAQNRYRDGVDATYPADGLLLWHVDSRVLLDGSFEYDNSYAPHKLLRLMEADGLEEIETGDGWADAGDYYVNGKSLSPTSSPNSKRYDTTDTGITVNDISVPGAQMTADFTLYTSNPPSVTITSPPGGNTVTGDETVEIDASDDNSVAKVQLLIDGNIVAEWTEEPYQYNWNSLVEFNKTMAVTARAWDAEGQAASDTISLTVSNTGVEEVFDDFEAGLSSWRAINSPVPPDSTLGGWNTTGGSYTKWSTRTSPLSPAPLGSGKEAWIEAPAATDPYAAADHLQSERIDATAYTRPLQIKFFYRTNTPLSLWATLDNGASWERIAYADYTTDWKLFTRSLHYQGEVVYFRLFYNGSFTVDSGLNANIDDLYIREATSEIPTAQFSSPNDGDAVSGSVNFNVNASDDGSIAHVLFYLNGTLVLTDNSAPWRYTRNTINDDNHPRVNVAAYAIDNQDLASDWASINVAFANSRPYPVFDDLEGGTTNWNVTTSDGPNPDWALITTESFSPTHSWAWAGAFGDYNSDTLRYDGYPPTSGRKCIDLAGTAVVEPVLRFKLKMTSLPADAGVRIRFLTTWQNYTLSWVYGSTSGWEDREFPLSDFVGWSGRIEFYARNYTINGTGGLYIDDVRVENHSPVIDSINPSRGTVGTQLTISGNGFGDARGSNHVTFGGGVQPPPADYVSWGNNTIVVKIPSGAVSGDVTVTVFSQTSNGVDVRVVLAPPDMTDLEQR